MCSLSSWLSAATSTKGEALANESIALTQYRARRRRRRRCSQLSVAPERNLSVCRKELIELSKCGVSHADIGIQEIVDRQSQSHSQTKINLSSMGVGFGMDMVNTSMDCTRAPFPQLRPAFLQDAYDHCRRICANTSTSFYLATLSMTKERQKAIWAIYVWGSRTDELVDGHNARHMNGEAVLDQWEERLEDIFCGCPYDMLDAALADTVQKFPIDIKPFKDLIEGMRMDTRKFRYENFKELYLYCYYVAGTVALMTVPVLGIAPESTTSPSTIHSIYDSALYLGIGSQLTNILRDVTEDASMGRVYLPQDELAQFGLCDEDIMSRKVSDAWKGFTKEQIKRARFYFNMAEKGASQLHKDSRWPVWSSLLLYRKILDTIEENNYDNLTKRASIGTAKKIFMLALALRKALPISNLSFSPSHYSP